MRKNVKECLQEITEQESVTIYCVKAFAILSVIAAHVNTIVDTSLLEKYITSIWSVVGRVGVICFFIIGGFFYIRRENDAKIFWKKKLLKLIMPWIICSTLTYIYGVVMSGKKLMIFEYVKWIFGSGTWYYYIVVFLFYLLIFKFIYKSNFLLYTTIIINVLALIFKTIGFTINIEWKFLTDYLNPFYWIGFFSVGVIMRKYRLDRKIISNNSIFILCLLGIIFSTYIIINYQIFTYFHILSAINSLLSFVIIYRVSYWLSKFKLVKRIKTIGLSTYCIYLLHMFIVQSFVRLLPDNIFKYLFGPVLSLGVMMILIKIGIFVCDKIPFGSKIKSAVGL